MSRRKRRSAGEAELVKPVEVVVDVQEVKPEQVENPRCALLEAWRKAEEGRRADETLRTVPVSRPEP